MTPEEFVSMTKNDPLTTEKRIISFALELKSRHERGEIAAGTVHVLNALVSRKTRTQNRKLSFKCITHNTYGLTSLVILIMFSTKPQFP
jgi:hypothetical protein